MNQPPGNNEKSNGHTKFAIILDLLINHLKISISLGQPLQIQNLNIIPETPFFIDFI